MKIFKKKTKAYYEAPDFYKRLFELGVPERYWYTKKRELNFAQFVYEDEYDDRDYEPTIQVQRKNVKKILEKSGRVKFINGYTRSLNKKGDKVDHVLLETGEKVSGDVYFLSPGATFSKIIEASDLGLQFPKIFYGVGCSVLLKTGEMTLSNCVRTPNRGLACGVYSAPQDKEHTLVGASNFISPGGISLPVNSWYTSAAMPNKPAKV